MMSRRNTFASLSSSRQMMIAWNVSALSHNTAIIDSRPAQAGDPPLPSRLDALGNGDLAGARKQLDRSHRPQIHAHGIVRALGRLLGLGLGRNLLLRLDQFAALRLGLVV